MVLSRLILPYSPPHINHQPTDIEQSRHYEGPYLPCHASHSACFSMSHLTLTLALSRCLIISDLSLRHGN